jgi:hypothetical protein
MIPRYKDNTHLYLIYLELILLGFRSENPDVDSQN